MPHKLEGLLRSLLSRLLFQQLKHQNQHRRHGGRKLPPRFCLSHATYHLRRLASFLSRRRDAVSPFAAPPSASLPYRLTQSLAGTLHSTSLQPHHNHIALARNSMVFRIRFGNTRSCFLAARDSQVWGVWNAGHGADWCCESMLAVDCFLSNGIFRRGHDGAEDWKGQRGQSVGEEAALCGQLGAGCCRDGANYDSPLQTA